MDQKRIFHSLTSKSLISDYDWSYCLMAWVLLKTQIGVSLDISGIRLWTSVSFSFVK